MAFGKTTESLDFLHNQSAGNDIRKSKAYTEVESNVKQAKEGSKKTALEEAISKYMNIKEPNIQIITSDNIDLSKKTEIPPVQVQKEAEENNIQKQEEEDYHAFVESKKENQNQPKPQTIDSSSQAAMVKDLFDGKYLT